MDKQIFMEGLLCAKHFLRDPAGNKGAKLCIREVRVLWQQTGKHRAQPWGHRSSGISQNLQDGSEEAKRVQSGSQAEPTKSWGKSWEELTAIQDAWRWRAKEEPRKAKQRLVHSGVWLPKQSRSCGHTVLPGARTQGCRSAHRLFWGHPPPRGFSLASRAVLPRSLHLSGCWRAEGKSEQSTLGRRWRGARRARAPGEERGDSAHRAAANLGPRLLLGSPGALLLLLSACS